MSQLREVNQRSTDVEGTYTLPTNKELQPHGHNVNAFRAAICFVGIDHPPLLFFPL